MKKSTHMTRNLTLIAGLLAIGIAVPACSEEDARAVLAGIQVVADELDNNNNNNDDISFGDWIRSELDD